MTSSSSAKILDGKLVASVLLADLKKEIDALRSKNIQPCVAFIRVGEDPASIAYVSRKQAVARDLGIESILQVFPSQTTQDELLAAIDALAKNPAVHGILIQSPLPSHISSSVVFNSAPAHKDVDGFSATNIGQLAQGDIEGLIACTPLGIYRLLQYYQIPTAGRHVVIIGRSNIVGRPLSLLLSARAGGNATVTVCHKDTQNIKDITRSADILVAASGIPLLVKADWIKPGATVIDVGITRVVDPSKPSVFNLCGDVDFDPVSKIAGFITPVPGGVGPMTVAMLMSNTVKAAQGN